MSKTLPRVAAICVIGTAGFLLSAARAQTMDGAAFYSQGVQAYFAGQSSQAEGYLSTALALNPNDPRAYYFRALAMLRQGRSDIARTDMQMGAAIEAQQPNRFAVGAALERVQGPDRLLLEQFRRDGQMSEARQRMERNQARYEQIRGREPETLHQTATIPLGGLLQTSGSRPVVLYGQTPQPRLHATQSAGAARTAATGAANASDPFSDDAAGASAASTNPLPIPPATPAASGGPAVTQPRTPAKAPDDDNPFGAPQPTAPVQKAPPSAPAKATTPTPAGDDNPFRTP